MKFGVDPVHFGMIMVVNLAMGMITPPFGVNLYAACAVAKISLDKMIPKLIPFVLVVLGCVLIITYFPSRSEEHTSELQSLMRLSYAVFCLKKKTNKQLNILNK